MKYRQPIFALAVIAAGAAVFFAMKQGWVDASWLQLGRSAERISDPGRDVAQVGQRASETGESNENARPAAVTLSESAPSSSAAAPELPSDDVLVRASNALRRSPPFEAKLRQNIDLFGQQLVGSGWYAHAGNGSIQFRLETKIQLEKSTTSLIQVCDGRYVWTRRDVGNEPRLSRIDLQRIQQAVSRSSGGGARDDRTNGIESPAAERDRETAALNADPSAMFGIGGIAGLVESLAANFEFTSPGATQLGSLPVWATTGKWRQDSLARLLGAKPEEVDGAEIANANGPVVSLAISSTPVGQPDDTQVASSALPEYLPTSVAVALGRDDYLPLFPYRIELRRDDPPGNPATLGPTTASPSRVLMSIELYEVRAPAPFDSRVFTYDAGDQEVIDDTDAFLQRLARPATRESRSARSPDR